MNWEFLVFGFSNVVKRYPIRQGVEYIGRQESVAYLLPESCVGRQAIEVRADGDRVTVTELGSRGGVFLNNKIFNLQTRLLVPGDIICICDYRILFKKANPEEANSKKNTSLQSLGSNPEYRAILETIIANPTDNAPRFVISDWLEEHDFLNYANFIRTQLAAPTTSDNIIDIAQKTSHFLTYQNLLKKWLSLFSNDAWFWRFKRGFISEIRLSSEEFMAHAKELFSTFPIEKVSLTNLNPTPLRQFRRTETFSWTESSGSSLNISGLRIDSLPAIPHELFQQMQLLGNSVDSYSSEDQAMEALSTACIAYGRGL